MRTNKKLSGAETDAQETRRTIPQDPEQSVYRFIVVAGQRTRQLQTGSCRPKIHMPARKMTCVAMQEVRRGLIECVNPETAPPEDEAVTDQ